MLIEEGFLLFVDFRLDLHLVRAEAHQTGYLLDRQSSCQVVRSFFGRKSPVLIRKKLAGLCQILKRKTVFFDDLYTGFGIICEGFAAFIFNNVEFVRRFCLFPHNIDLLVYLFYKQIC